MGDVLGCLSGGSTAAAAAAAVAASVLHVLVC